MKHVAHPVAYPDPSLHHPAQPQVNNVRARRPDHSPKGQSPVASPCLVDTSDTALSPPEYLYSAAPSPDAVFSVIIHWWWPLAKM